MHESQVLCHDFEKSGAAYVVLSMGDLGLKASEAQSAAQSAVQWAWKNQEPWSPLAVNQVLDAWWSENKGQSGSRSTVLERSHRICANGHLHETGHHPTATHSRKQRGLDVWKKTHVPLRHDLQRACSRSHVKIRMSTFLGFLNGSHRHIEQMSIMTHLL